MENVFPRQDIPEADKYKDNQKWFKNVVDYAVFRHINARRRRIERIRREYNGYNGLVNEAEFAMYNRTYGKENMVKYIDYRLCRTKMDHLVGEMLEQPINGTVYVTNPDAHVRKLENVYPLIGLHHVEKDVNDLRQKVGVNIFDGMTPPKVAPGKSIFDMLSAKSKNERNMQIILNRQLVDMDMKLKFSDNMYDMVLISESFGKTYIDDRGDVKYRSIAPEMAIYEESERDPFLEKTPYIGEERIMFLSDILKEFRPNKEIADKLNARANGREQIDESTYSDNYDRVEGVTAFRVYTVQWIGCEVAYLKTSKGKDGEEVGAEMSQAYYLKNKERVDFDVQNGKYSLQVKYDFVTYEGVRIAQDIYINLGKAKNVPFLNANPSKACYNYHGLLFNTRGGVRVSIKQLTEHIDRMYNMTMWQLNRELAKSKGKVLFYDLAYLPKGKKLKDVMYNMANDQVVPYNSAADGNRWGKEGAGNVGISEADMGMSSTVAVLINLKANLEQMADKITGVVAGRMGNISASATVQNTKESIDNSLTTTAPLFYFFAKFQENVIRQILELSKLSWGVIKPEKGEMVLGMEGLNYLIDTKDIPFDDYGYTLADSRKEMQVRNMLTQYMNVALNGNPDLIDAAINAELAETATEAQMIVKQALKELRDIQDRQAQAQAEAEQQVQQQQAGTQMELNNNDANNRLKEIALRGQTDVAKKTAQQMNEHMQNMRQQPVTK